NELADKKPCCPSNDPVNNNQGTETCLIEDWMQCGCSLELALDGFSLISTDDRAL
ncbi:hypothetical protein KUCAC02_005233, partial [Chaenocephalus aceratus]